MSLPRVAPTLLLLLLAGVSLADPPPRRSATPWRVLPPTVSGKLRAPACQDVLVCAHRGNVGPSWALRYLPRATTDRPENSIEALEAAVAAGAELVEVDVRHTADERLVLMHDATLDRTTRARGRVDGKTLAELRAVELVPGGRIPTLEEALRWAKGRTILDLDVKTDRIDLVVDAIGRAEAWGHCVIYERDVDVLRAAVRRDSRVQVMLRLLPGQDLDALLRELHPPLVQMDLEQLTPEVVAKVRAAGSRTWLNALGARDVRAALGEDPYSELIRRGADVIQTDRAELLVPLARRESALRYPW